MNGGMQAGPFKKISQLLQNASVHDELNLTDVQKTDLTSALGEVRQNLSPEVQKIQTLPEDERQQSRMELLGRLNREVDTALAGVFAPEQHKRFKEIRFRMQGINFFSDKDIQTQLGLTEEQIEQMRAVVKDVTEKAKSVRQSGRGNPQESRKQMKELKTQTMDKVMAVFSEEQRTKWQEMIGEEFELKPQPAGGPGMGGPGMQRPGMGGPGMQRPGMGGPGMQRPGMGGPGMQRPGMGGPGMQRPGMQRPGMGGGRPGMGGPGMGRPGAGGHDDGSHDFDPFTMDDDF